MKLKGVCKIILRDGESGKIVHEEEHSNTITPALSRIFANNISGTVDFTKITPILNKLLGGVCLWNGSPNSSDIYLPKQEDALLTAHAGQNTYSSSSDDVSRGNPNTDPNSGSRPIQNGYKFVWDWAQSQGVGRISDLTLVHSDVGDYYNQLHKELSLEPVEDISNYLLNGNEFVYSSDTPQPSQLPKVVGIANEKKIPIGFYGDNNHVVSIELEETEQYTEARGGDWRRGVMNVYISKFTGSGLWLWNNLGDIEVERKIVITNIVWQQANFNNLGRCILYVAYDESIKHLYIIWGGSIQTFDDPQPTPPYNFQWRDYGYSIDYIDYDLESGTKVSREVELPSDLILYMIRMHNEVYEPIQLQISEGCVVLPLFNNEYHSDTQSYDITNYGDRGVRINLRTGAIMDYVEGSMAEIGNNARTDIGMFNLGNERVMYPDCIVEKRAGVEQIDMRTIGESISKSSRFYAESIPRRSQIFGTEWRSNRVYVASSSDSLIQFVVSNGNTGDNKLRGAVLNKMYQASVFHLNNAIYKTGSQTMTVEYTITQVLEEDEEEDNE